MLIGVILLALLATIAFIKMPGEKDHSSPLDIKSTIRRLWGNRRYRYGVIAQFFYVGVQTGVWSFTIRLTMAQLNVLEKDASMVFLYSILAFTLFRFLFTWLMAYIKPVRLLAAASVMAIACTSVVIFSTGPAAIVALVAISACMSLMFPTIYGIALNGIGGDSAKIAASGLIMAILGGALLTPLQALVSDVCGISYSFAVPLLCFAVVLAYAAGIIMRTAKARSERGCGISNP
jgi:FHS family L-fucose permease-like MFS transporter